MKNEKMKWLGFVGLGLAVLGLAIFFMPGVDNVFGYALLFIGLGLSVTGIVINRKEKHVVALVTAVITVTLLGLVAAAQTITSVFNYERYFQQEQRNQAAKEQQEADEDLQAGIIDAKREGADVVKKHIGDTVSEDDVHVTLSNFKQYKGDVKSVDVKIVNDGETSINLTSDVFAVFRQISNDKWSFSDYMNDEGVKKSIKQENQNVKFLEPEIIESGETNKGTLAFEIKDTSDAYVMFKLFNDNVYSFKLK